jgi:hypothetical protein
MRITPVAERRSGNRNDTLDRHQKKSSMRTRAKEATVAGNIVLIPARSGTMRKMTLDLNTGTRTSADHEMLVRLVANLQQIVSWRRMSPHSLNYHHSQSQSPLHQRQKAKTVPDSHLHLQILL